MVGKRHRGAKQLGSPVLWHELGRVEPQFVTLSAHLSPCQQASAQLFADGPDPPEGSCGATEFVLLCCMLDLLYTKHMTREPVFPIATSIKPLQPALPSSVNMFHAFIKWMH